MKKNRWERFYDFMHRVNRTIEMHPNAKHFDIEMDIDLYRFANKIGFISNKGAFKFRDRSFALCNIY